MSQAHVRRLGELLEPPGMLGIDQEHSRYPGRSRREQRPEGARGRAEVGLALLLDQDLVEGEVTVAGEIEIPDAGPPQQGGALGTHILGDCHWVGGGQIPPELSKAGDRLSDPSRLSDGTEFEK
jgi:hypothetical protein